MALTSFLNKEWLLNLNRRHFNFETKVINAAAFNQVDTGYDFAVTCMAYN